MHQRGWLRHVGWAFVWGGGIWRIAHFGAEIASLRDSRYWQVFLLYGTCDLGLIDLSGFFHEVLTVNTLVLIVLDSLGFYSFLSSLVGVLSTRFWLNFRSHRSSWNFSFLLFFRVWYNFLLRTRCHVVCHHSAKCPLSFSLFTSFSWFALLILTNVVNI